MQTDQPDQRIRHLAGLADEDAQGDVARVALGLEQRVMQAIRDGARDALGQWEVGFWRAALGCAVLVLSLGAWSWWDLGGSPSDVASSGFSALESVTTWSPW